jgi:hypothetical protein
MPRASRKLTLDLHGHDARTALDLARTRVAEAWRNGYQEVELLHGAAYVQAPGGPRGKIKFGLRRMVEEGEFDAFIDRTRTWLRSDAIVLYLKPNPRAARQRWSPAPRRAYDKRSC